MLVVKSSALPAALPAVAEFLNLPEPPPDFSSSGGKGGGGGMDGAAAPTERLLHVRPLPHEFARSYVCADVVSVACRAPHYMRQFEQNLALDFPVADLLLLRTVGVTVLRSAAAAISTCRKPSH